MLHHDTRYLRNCIAELFLGHMLGEKHFCREPSNKKKHDARVFRSQHVPIHSDSTGERKTTFEVKIFSFEMFY